MKLSPGKRGRHQINLLKALEVLIYLIKYLKTTCLLGILSCYGDILNLRESAGYRAVRRKYFNLNDYNSLLLLKIKHSQNG